MKQIVFSIFLILLPMVARADAVEINGIYYYLVTEAQTAKVTGNPNKYSGDVVIPESVEYNGSTYTVTSIGDYAFSYCSLITSVTIPNSVTSIGGDAFEYCSNLTSVTIPNRVTSIGVGTFSNCTGLKMVKSEISMPFDVGNAFSWDPNIDFDPFDPDAYVECDRSRAILFVPKGTRAAYKSVSGWDFVYIYEGETNYDIEQTDEQGVRYTLRQADDYTFYYAVTGHTDELNAEIVIPADLDGCPVKAIEWAFVGCTSLSSITIPNSVTTIRGAFRECSSLASVTIPNSVTSIGYDAFFGCSGLISVTIPNSVTSIDEQAFKGCSGLTSITIPNSVTSIGYDAFFGCVFRDS